MTNEEVAAYGSLVVALISAAIAIRANGIAKGTNSLTVQIFQRTGVIDLWMAWKDMSGLDPKAPKLAGNQVIAAANACSLTASLWLHDVMDKEILYQSYFEPMDELLRVLDGYTGEIIEHPGKKGKDFISPPTRKAWNEMKDFAQGKIKSSKINLN